MRMTSLQWLGFMFIVNNDRCIDLIKIITTYTNCPLQYNGKGCKWIVKESLRPRIKLRRFPVTKLIFISK